MQEYYLYVDDTGFNQNQKQSKVLQNELATSAGVLISKELEPYLSNIISGLGDVLKNKYGVSEFHFTDIYNRKEPFSNIHPEETINLLETFASIITDFDLDVVVFTNKQDDTTQERQLKNLIDSLSPTLSMPTGPKTQALFLNIFRAKMITQTEFGDSKITKIISDEGLRKNGASVKINEDGTTIDFKSSKDCPLLQLADYCAWMITRAKNIYDKIGTKKHMSDMDEKVLEIYSSIADHYHGLTKKFINLENLSEFDYDSICNKIEE